MHEDTSPHTQSLTWRSKEVCGQTNVHVFTGLGEEPEKFVQEHWESSTEPQPIFRN